MTYQEALAFWFDHANYEQRAPAPGDLKLEHMRALLRRLGDPHRRLRILHVAGSKGKGSTAAMLATILTRAGYRTGLFTSPHLVHHEERFQVDGMPISSGELTQLLHEIRLASERPLDALATPPTFFEIATAAGFLHFLRRRCDAVVLEVGLGGRLDSTNVCLPVISVITSISFDHTRILGNRLAQIAAEKAGIVKPGRPVISGTTGSEARAVIEEICQRRRAPLVEIDRDFQVVATPGQVRETGLIPPRIQVTTSRRRWPELSLNLLGAHQATNAAVVVACVEQLVELGWHLPDSAVARGLAEVFWPARLEIVGYRPLMVLDCAHNVASAEAVVETLRDSFSAGRRWLVFAGSGDKDVAGMFRVLAGHFDGAYLTRYTNNSRALAPESLAQLWQQAGGSAPVVEPNPRQAVDQARQKAGENGQVVVTGSVFLAGEIRPWLVGA